MYDLVGQVFVKFARTHGQWWPAGANAGPARRAPAPGAGGRSWGRRLPRPCRAGLGRRAAQCRHLRERHDPAAFGGNTTLISFAAQHRGLDLRKIVDDYSVLARRGALIDYAFHLIVANPDAKTIQQDLPALIREGHASIKVFMTYDLIKVDDEPLLDLLTARQNRAPWSASTPKTTA